MWNAECGIEWAGAIRKGGHEAQRSRDQFRIPHSAFRTRRGGMTSQHVDLLAIAAELGRDACYLAGLAKYGPAGAPHRPFKILHALAYREDPVKPTFVVDISETFELKMQAIRCYASQFDGAKAAGEIFPTGQDL